MDISRTLSFHGTRAKPCGTQGRASSGPAGSAQDRASSGPAGDTQDRASSGSAGSVQNRASSGPAGSAQGGKSSGGTTSCSSAGGGTSNGPAGDALGRVSNSSAGGTQGRKSTGAHDACMHARDWIIVVIITVLYAALAFWNLGDMRAVENGYTTCEANEQITFDFGETESLATMQFYSYSLQTRLVPITIETSLDGSTWEVQDAKTRSNATPSYGFSSQFCWQDVNLYHVQARAVRITVPDAGTTFFELAFHASDGRALSPTRIASSYSGTRDTGGSAGERAAAGAGADAAAASADAAAGTDVGASGVNVTANAGAATNTTNAAGATAAGSAGADAAAASAATNTTNAADAAAAGSAAGAAGAADTATSQESNSLSALFDEQDLVPALSDFMNSTYFDEIYHARTAYEMLHGLPWYENTHPPLGKAIMEASIATLGMNPFAWRMPGTLAGVLMLPLIFLMAKLLFRRRSVATFATMIFALDCMHYSQTRIATIDSFTLLFILALFYLLFRYVLRERTFDEKMPLQAGTLLAAGIAMGFACATKWIGFYAAVGAAIILFAHWIRLGIEARGTRAFWIRWVKTAGICVLAFLVVPFCIYFASFGQSYTSWTNAPAEFWAQQVTMLSYHTNLNDTHYFASPWYEWPLDLMPMWWFVSSDTTTASTINTMGNPIVWWAGLAAIIALAAYVAVQFAVYMKNARHASAASNNGEENASGSCMEAPCAHPTTQCVGAQPAAWQAEQPADAQPAMQYMKEQCKSPCVKGQSAAQCMEAQPALQYAAQLAKGQSFETQPPEARPAKTQPAAAQNPTAPPTLLPYSLQAGWLILVCYLCLYVPWMLVPRLTFIYHYFTCTPFLVLALAFWVRRGLSLQSKNARTGMAVAAIAFTVLAAAAFALFFPVISGLEVSPDYIELTKWLPRWVIWHA